MGFDRLISLRFFCQQFRQPVNDGRYGGLIVDAEVRAVVGFPQKSKDHFGCLGREVKVNCGWCVHDFFRAFAKHRSLIASPVPPGRG